MKIAVNEKFRWKGTPFETLWKSDDNQDVVIRNLDTQEIKPLSITEIHDAMSSGEICPFEIRPVDDHSIKRLVDLPRNCPARLDAEYKLVYAKYIVRNQMPARNEDAYLDRIAKQHHHNRIPRPSTARRWAQGYKAQGEMALLDGRRLKQRTVAGLRV